MQDELKLLFAVNKKLLYSEKTLSAINRVSNTGASPSAGIAKVLAVVFQQSVAKAQQAGAQIDNKLVMQAAAMLVKEALEILKKNAQMDKQKITVVGKALLAMLLKELKSLVSLQQGRAQQAKPQGMIQQQMGAA
jgi:hypothetical protein